MAERKLDHIKWLFFVLYFVHVPFEQGIPCLLEASNTTTGTILLQVVILRGSKKGHNLCHMGSLRLSIMST